MNFIRLFKLTCAVAVTAAVALPAHADFIALDSTRASGNQSWTGPLGMDFNVLSAIRITQLGVFDSGSNGLANGIIVGIFNRTTQLLVGSSATLTTANTTTAGTGSNNRFFDIADFVLGVGQYTIVTDGYSSAEQNGNAGSGGTAPTIDTGGGLIAFTGSARYGSQAQGLVYPSIVDGGPVNRYDAGTFMFTAAPELTSAAVPEPASLALFALGLAGLGFSKRKKA